MKKKIALLIIIFFVVIIAGLLVYRHYNASQIIVGPHNPTPLTRPTPDTPLIVNVKYSDHGRIVFDIGVYAIEPIEEIGLELNDCKDVKGNKVGNPEIIYIGIKIEAEEFKAIKALVKSKLEPGEYKCTLIASDATCDECDPRGKTEVILNIE